MPLPLVVVQPSEEPISLEEAKKHLRLEDDVDDDEVEAAIQAARDHVERVTGRGLLLQTLELELGPTRDRFVALPGGHLADLNTVVVQYVDEALQVQTLNPSSYYATRDGNADKGPGKLFLSSGVEWPAMAARNNSLRIRYQVGWANRDALPKNIGHAVKLLVSHFYENRTPVVTGTIAVEVPMAVDALLDPVRFWKL